MSSYYVEDDEIIQGASMLGYDTTLRYPMLCTNSDGSLSYTAYLRNRGNVSDFAVVQSEPTRSAGIQTLLYRNFTKGSMDLVFADGGTLHLTPAGAQPIEQASAAQGEALAVSASNCGFNQCRTQKLEYLDCGGRNITSARCAAVMPGCTTGVAITRGNPLGVAICIGIGAFCITDSLSPCPPRKQSCTTCACEPGNCTWHSACSAIGDSNCTDVYRQCDGAGTCVDPCTGIDNTCTTHTCQASAGFIFL